MSPGFGIDETCSYTPFNSDEPHTPPRLLQREGGFNYKAVAFYSYHIHLWVYTTTGVDCIQYSLVDSIPFDRKWHLECPMTTLGHWPITLESPSWPSSWSQRHTLHSSQSVVVCPVYLCFRGCRLIYRTTAASMSVLGM
jgi:hypothetical protein